VSLPRGLIDKVNALPTGALEFFESLLKLIRSGRGSRRTSCMKLLHEMKRLSEKELAELERRVREHLEAVKKRTPAKLGGLLAGFTFSEKDISKARRDMWGRFRNGE
jgi:hypothetical protein